MTSSDTYILFQLAGATYGVRSDQVLHVDMLENVTPVPNTAAAVEGVVFSRGQVIPALNLRARFGLPREAHTPSTRLIFLRAHQRTIAFIADSAREFRRIPPTNVRPVTETLHGIRGNYVQGVANLGDRVILLLDIPAVLDLEEVQALGNIAETGAPAPS